MPVTAPRLLQQRPLDPTLDYRALEGPAAKGYEREAAMQQRQADEAESRKQKAENEIADQERRRRNGIAKHELKRAGRPFDVDETGAPVPFHTDEEWEQEQQGKVESEKRKVAFENQKTAWQIEGRPFVVDSNTGAPVPKHDEATWTRLKEQKAAEEREAIRQAPLKQQLETLKLDLSDPDRRPLPKTSREAKEEALKQTTEAAAAALETRLQEAAAQRSGADDWVPFNETATPEATKAAERLAQIQARRQDAVTTGQPFTLDDDDLADLEAVDKTAAQKLKELQTTLGADTERRRWREAAARKAHSLSLQITNPAEWERREKARLEAAGPDALQDEAAQRHDELAQRLPDLEAQAADLNAAASALTQERDAILAENEQHRAAGISAADLLTSPDGQTWHRESAQKLRDWEVRAQTAEQELQPKLMEHEAALAAFNRDAALAEHAATIANSRRREQYTARLAKLRSTPGLAPFADQLDALEKETVQRRKAIDDQYGPEDSEAAKLDPARAAALEAMARDITEKQAAIQKGIAAKEQAGAALYAMLKENRIRPEQADKVLHPYDHLGLTREEALGWIAHEAAADFDTGNPADETRTLPDGSLAVNPKLWGDSDKARKAIEQSKADEHAKQDALASLPRLKEQDTIAKTLDFSKGNTAEPVRTLPDGSLALNPALHAEPDKLRAGIEASAATAEAKQSALSQLPQLEQQAHERTASLLHSRVGSFADFVTKHHAEALVPTLGSGMTPEEQQRALSQSPFKTAKELLEAFRKERGAAAHLDRIKLGLEQGFGGITQSVFGAAGGLTRSTALLEAAGRVSEQTGHLARAGDAVGRGGFTQALASGAVSLLPSMVGGGVVGGVVRRIVAGKLAAGAITAKTAATLAQKAGLNGAAAAAGLQTFGSTFSDAFTAYRQQGMGETEAMNAAYLPAIAGGLGTMALTRFMPGGVERVFSPVARKAFTADAKGLLKAAGFFVKEGSQEFAEEAADQFLQGVIARMSYAPGKSFESIIRESFEAGAVGFVLGGTIGAVAQSADPAATAPDEDDNSLEDWTTPAEPSAQQAPPAAPAEASGALSPQAGAAPAAASGAVAAAEAPGGAPPAAPGAASAQSSDGSLPSGPKIDGGTPSLLPEQVAAAEAQIAAWTGEPAPDGTAPDPQLVADQQARARAALKIAQGGIDTLSEAELNATGWTRQGGTLKPLKGYTGPKVLYFADPKSTQPVITDTFRSSLTAKMPAAGALIGMDEAAARQLYKQQQHADQLTTWLVEDKKTDPAAAKAQVKAFLAANPQAATADYASAKLAFTDWVAAQGTQGTGTKAQSGKAETAPVNSVPVASVPFPGWNAAAGQVLGSKAAQSKPKAKEALDTLAAEIERWKSAFTGGIEVVPNSDPPPGGGGIWVEGGKLKVHLARFAQNHGTRANTRHIAAMVVEEVIHLIAQKKIPDIRIHELWLGLPKGLRQTVWTAYYRSDITSKAKPEKVPEQLDEGERYRMGHEFLRMLVQDSAFRGEVTEACEDNPALLKRILALLQRLAKHLRDAVNHLPGSQRKQIENYEAAIRRALEELQSGKPASSTGNKVDLAAEAPSVLARPPVAISQTTPHAVVKKAVTGSTGTAYTNANDPIEFKWAVVEADDLVISNHDSGSVNPRYPQALQPRDRTTQASQAQVQKIASAPNFDLLSDSNLVGNGAPIIGDDAVVESGNGRTMGLRRAYAQDHASTYRDALMQRAAAYGLDPEAIKGMKAPVLVRLRTTPLDMQQRVAFSEAANVASVAAMSEPEQAAKDAKKLEAILPLFSDESDDITGADNRDFVNAFFRDVPTEERGPLVAADGTLSQLGLRRLRNALFVYAYGGSPEAQRVFSRLSESTEEGSRNLLSALTVTAPRFATQKAGMAAGALHRSLDATPDIIAAAHRLMALREKGQSVADFLGQDQIPGVGEEMPAPQRDLLRAFDEHGRSSRRLREVLLRYQSAVDKAGDPLQGALFGEEKPDKAALVHLAVTFTPGLEASASTVTPEQDAAYMEAVQRGDMETAQRMVDEAARRAGFAVEAWHATNRKTWMGSSFKKSRSDRLIHFGSHEAAWQRARDKGIPGDDVEARPFYIKGPFLSFPDAGSWDDNAIWERIVDSGAWTQQEADDIAERLEKLADENAAEFWRSEFGKKGFGGVEYENLGEGVYGDLSYGVFDPSQIKSADPVTYDAAGNVIPLSRRFNPESNSILESSASSAGRRTPVTLPKAVIASKLGVLRKHPDFQAGKAGDTDAAFRAARDVMTPEFIAQVRGLVGGEHPVILPVRAVESGGTNKLPSQAAVRLADALNLQTADGIVQAERANRGSMSGLDRVFRRVRFDGPVIPGQAYLLVDDTLTQGGTFADLADHIQAGGGRVIGAVALTGHDYSATLAPTDELLAQLRQQHGDLEAAFREATGHGFSHLTQSEARTLLTWRPADAVRARILAERDARVRKAGPGTAGAGEGGAAHLGSGLESSASTASLPPPKAALRIYRRFFQQQQAGEPLTPAQQRAMEKAERALGQTFLFDDIADQLRRPAEDLSLEQDTALDTTPQRYIQPALFSSASEPGKPPRSFLDRLLGRQKGQGTGDKGQAPSLQPPAPSPKPSTPPFTGSTLQRPPVALAFLPSGATVEHDRDTVWNSLAAHMASAQDARGTAGTLPGGDGTGGPLPATGSQTEADHLRRWGTSNGRTLDPVAFARWVAQGPDGQPRQNRGRNEHVVYYDEASDRMVKITHAYQYGSKGLAAWISNAQKANARWGDDLHLVGVVEMEPGNVQLVMSQPFIPQARPATRTEIDWVLYQQGYRRVSDLTYFHPDREEAVSDTQEENVLWSALDRRAHPVDVHFFTPSQSMVEMWENVINAGVFPVPGDPEGKGGGERGEGRREKGEGTLESSASTPDFSGFEKRTGRGLAGEVGAAAKWWWNAAAGKVQRVLDAVTPAPPLDSKEKPRYADPHEDGEPTEPATDAGAGDRRGARRLQDRAVGTIEELLESAIRSTERKTTFRYHSDDAQGDLTLDYDSAGNLTASLHEDVARHLHRQTPAQRDAELQAINALASYHSARGFGAARDFAGEAIFHDLRRGFQKTMVVRQAVRVALELRLERPLTIQETSRAMAYVTRTVMGTQHKAGDREAAVAFSEFLVRQAIASRVAGHLPQESAGLFDGQEEWLRRVHETLDRFMDWALAGGLWTEAGRKEKVESGKLKTENGKLKAEVKPVWRSFVERKGREAKEKRARTLAARTPEQKAAAAAKARATRAQNQAGSARILARVLRDAGRAASRIGHVYTRWLDRHQQAVTEQERKEAREKLLGLRREAARRILGTIEADPEWDAIVAGLWATKREEMLPRVDRSRPGAKTALRADFETAHFDDEDAGLLNTAQELRSDAAAGWLREKFAAEITDRLTGVKPLERPFSQVAAGPADEIGGPVASFFTRPDKVLRQREGSTLRAINDVLRRRIGAELLRDGAWEGVPLESSASEPENTPRPGGESVPVLPHAIVQRRYHPDALTDEGTLALAKAAGELGRSQANHPDRLVHGPPGPHLRRERARQVEALHRQAVSSTLDTNRFLGRGGEHNVYLSDDGRNVTKVTMADAYGYIPTEETINGHPTGPLHGVKMRDALPSEYLLRWAIFSHIFDIPVRLVRVAARSMASPAIEVEMPYVPGDEYPDLPLIARFMEAHGFERVRADQLQHPEAALHGHPSHARRMTGLTWYRAEDGILITDAGPRNFKIDPTTRGIVPIDLMLALYPLAMPGTGTQDASTPLESSASVPDGITAWNAPEAATHAADLWDMYAKSYGAIGMQFSQADELLREPVQWHAALDGAGKPIAFFAWKTTAAGHKLTVTGTDQSDAGRAAWKRLIGDYLQTPGYYAELSDAPEHIARKLGVPILPASQAGSILGKTVEELPDGEHYKRSITGLPHPHIKAMFGLPWTLRPKPGQASQTNSSPPPVPGSPSQDSAKASATTSGSSSTTGPSASPTRTGSTSSAREDNPDLQSSASTPSVPPARSWLHSADRHFVSGLKRAYQAAGLPKAIAAFAGFTDRHLPVIGKAIEIVREQSVPGHFIVPEVLAWLKQLQVKSAMGVETAMDIHRSMEGKAKFTDLMMPPDLAASAPARQRLYFAMDRTMSEETGITLDDLPPEHKAFALRLRKLLWEAGAEAVRQGRMSIETYERLRDGYLPHYYEADLKENSVIQRAARLLGLKDILAQRSTAWHIVDTETKDPRNPQEHALVSWDAKGAQWRFRSEEHRNAFYEEMILDRTHRTLQSRGRELRAITREQLRHLETIPDESRGRVREIILQQRRRYEKKAPLTVEQQEKAGLIMDPVFSAVKYLADMHHQNAVAEFFNKVAANPDYTTSSDTHGFKQIPDNRAYGALAGKWVQAPIANQVLDIVGHESAMMELYDDLVRLWASGKTVWNPGTHVRNVLGNFPFAILFGNNPLNPANWKHYGGALRVLRDGGDQFKLMYEHGVLGGDYGRNELRNALRELLPDSDLIGEKPPTRILARLTKHLFEKSQNKGVRGFQRTSAFLHAAYQVSDDVFKAAAFLKAMDSGSTPEQAAAEVQKWFPFYNQPGSSATIKAARRIFPFFSFFRESARIFTHAVRERPLALAGTMIVPYTLTQIMLALVHGMDDDDKEDVLKDMRGKLILPGVTGDAPVFSILMPWRTQGRLVQWDLSNLHPFASFLGRPLETGQRDDFLSFIARKLLTSSPLGNIGAGLALNRNPFDDREIAAADMTPAERNLERGKFAYMTLAPPLLGTTAAMIARSDERAANKTLEQRSQAEAVVRGIGGFDVRSASPDLYRQAEEFRVEQGRTLPPDFAGGTTASSRAKQQLKTSLLMDDPPLKDIAHALSLLKQIGHPVETQGDINALLASLNPDARLPKDLRERFRLTRAPESRARLDAARAEFQKLQAKAPAIIAKARPLMKPLTSLTVPVVR